jgi:ring-1,2-phenylacetyl-CoA epoxidase subunit PaaD
MIVLTKENILALLEEVKDPEIPVLSLVDMGIITAVECDAESVKIELTPTFVGCPALDVMKQEIAACLYRTGIETVEITVSYKEPWTSDKISEKGKAALKKYGLAPPPHTTVLEDIDFLEHAICPRCQGTNTSLKNAFGSTLCRSIHYCYDCREAFEQFKPL